MSAFKIWVPMEDKSKLHKVVLILKEKKLVLILEFSTWKKWVYFRLIK